MKRRRDEAARTSGRADAAHTAWWQPLSCAPPLQVPNDFHSNYLEVSQNAE